MSKRKGGTLKGNDTKKQTTLFAYFPSKNGGTSKPSGHFVEDINKKKGSSSTGTPIEPPKRDQKPFTRSINSGISFVMDPKVDSTSKGLPKKCPFYKIIPGTSFAVDAFEYGDIPGISTYFLSHYHYDHYKGLKKTFCKPICCSPITGRLLVKHLGISKDLLIVAEVEDSVAVSGVVITTLEANHCPGAVMFLFQLPSGKNILHTGDFRADKNLTNHKLFQSLVVDTVYLDTTYLNPQYSFPPQEDAVRFAKHIAEEYITENPETLIVCGAYTIGKEKIWKGIAEQLDCKVWCTAQRRRILECLEDNSIGKRITKVEREAQIHVLSMWNMNLQSLKRHLHKVGGRFKHVLGFKPSGWEFSHFTKWSSLSPQTDENVTLYGLPYSEHSSFEELQQFIKSLKPKKVIPTVYGGLPKSQMDEFFKKWMH